jgi:hypothetical protein
MLYRVHLALAGFEITTLVVIGNACTGSYKSNYHTITTTTTDHHDITKILLKVAFNTINQSTSHATRIERFNKGSDQLYRLLSLYIGYLQYLMLSNM